MNSIQSSPFAPSQSQTGYNGNSSAVLTPTMKPTTLQKESEVPGLSVRSGPSGNGGGTSGMTFTRVGANDRSGASDKSSTILNPTEGRIDYAGGAYDSAPNKAFTYQTVPHPYSSPLKPLTPTITPITNTTSATAHSSPPPSATSSRKTDMIQMSPPGLDPLIGSSNSLFKSQTEMIPNNNNNNNSVPSPSPTIPNHSHGTHNSSQSVANSIHPPTVSTTSQGTQQQSSGFNPPPNPSPLGDHSSRKLFKDREWSNEFKSGSRVPRYDSRSSRRPTDSPLYLRRNEGKPNHLEQLVASRIGAKDNNSTLGAMGDDRRTIRSMSAHVTNYRSPTYPGTGLRSQRQQHYEYRSGTASENHSPSPNKNPKQRQLVTGNDSHHDSSTGIMDHYKATKQQQQQQQQQQQPNTTNILLLSSVPHVPPAGLSKHSGHTNSDPDVSTNLSTMRHIENGIRKSGSLSNLIDSRSITYPTPSFASNTVPNLSSHQRESSGTTKMPYVTKSYATIENNNLPTDNTSNIKNRGNGNGRSALLEAIVPNSKTLPREMISSITINERLSTDTSAPTVSQVTPPSIGRSKLYNPVPVQKMSMPDISSVLPPGVVHDETAISPLVDMVEPLVRRNIDDTTSLTQSNSVLDSGTNRTSMTDEVAPPKMTDQSIYSRPTVLHHHHHAEGRSSNSNPNTITTTTNTASTILKSPISGIGLPTSSGGAMNTGNNNNNTSGGVIGSPAMVASTQVIHSSKLSKSLGGLSTNTNTNGTSSTTSSVIITPSVQSTAPGTSSGAPVTSRSNVSNNIGSNVSTSLTTSSIAGGKKDSLGATKPTSTSVSLNDTPSPPQKTINTKSNMTVSTLNNNTVYESGPGRSSFEHNSLTKTHEERPSITKNALEDVMIIGNSPNTFYEQPSEYRNSESENISAYRKKKESDMSMNKISNPASFESLGMYSQRSDKTLTTPHPIPGGCHDNNPSIRANTHISDTKGIESKSKSDPIQVNHSKRTVLSRTVMNNTDDIKVFTRNADGQIIEQAKMAPADNIFKSLGIETLNIINADNNDDKYQQAAVVESSVPPKRATRWTLQNAMVPKRQKALFSGLERLGYSMAVDDSKLPPVKDFTSPELFHESESQVDVSKAIDGFRSILKELEDMTLQKNFRNSLFLAESKEYPGNHPPVKPPMDFLACKFVTPEGQLLMNPLDLDWKDVAHGNDDSKRQNVRHFSLRLCDAYEFCDNLKQKEKENTKTSPRNRRRVEKEIESSLRDSIRSSGSLAVERRRLIRDSGEVDSRMTTVSVESESRRQTTMASIYREMELSNMPIHTSSRGSIPPLHGSSSHMIRTNPLNMVIQEPE